MEVSITQFRRKIFELVNLAMSGSDVWVTYKGRRFKVAPDREPGSRLGQITPLAIINPEAPPIGGPALFEEMARAWESDWSTL